MFILSCTAFMQEADCQRHTIRKSSRITKLALEVNWRRVCSSSFNVVGVDCRASWPLPHTHTRGVLCQR